MSLRVTEEERGRLVAAQRGSRGVRQWRRFQAPLLRAEGLPVTAVAQALSCTETSVCNGTARGRRAGVAGAAEGAHPGGAPRLDAAAERRVEALLTSDPRTAGDAATGWTVPLPRAELATRGWSASERAIRRALHRRGWRGKRPRCVLGRPDPAYAEERGRPPSE